VPPVDPPRSPPPSGVAGIALALPDSAEPTLVLDAGGGVHHRECAWILDGEGRLTGTIPRSPSLRIERGRIVDPDGATLFFLEEGALRRSDGRRVRVEGERVIFEGSEFELRVHPAPDPALVRTVLLLVAALGMCDG